MATKDLWANNAMEKADADVLGDLVDANTAAIAPVINVQSHGIVSDNGITDNLAALNTLISSAVEGSTIFFPLTNNTFYGFSGQIVINKSITLAGDWHRGTISGPIMGSVLGPTTTAAHLGMGSLIKVGSSRVRISGLALVGKPTLETNATVTVNGTNVHLSSLTATSALVGARVSGPRIISGTTVSAVNTGTNNITLSQTTAGERITWAGSDPGVLALEFLGGHNLSVGDTITLSGFTPSAFNSTWTISTVVDWQYVQIVSALNPGTATVIGTYTATRAGCALQFGADGIEFNSTGEAAHLCNMDRVHIEGFREGVAFGYSDHVTLTDSELTGNYDNVSFRNNNDFDYSFINCTLVGATRSSMYIARNTTVVNLSCIRTHLGWSQYGIFQDTATVGDGNGLKGVSFIASPIENISKRQISIANGGSMFFDAGGYWQWSGATPQGPAFLITGLQNTGAITFQAALEGNNANCPYLFWAGGQVAGSVFRFESTLSTAEGNFAVAAIPNSGYTSDRIPGQVYHSGNFVEMGNNTNLNVYGPLNLRNGGSTGSTVYGGTGVPASGLGVNGDLYFRADTPGTALQRIYVKAAGAWSGIV